MPHKSKNPQLARFDKSTEACPKMTRRWRRDVLPELVAWLGLHIVRAERAKAHAQQAFRESPAGVIGETVQYYAVRLKVLRELSAQVADKWDDYLWWQCAQVVIDAGKMPAPKPVHTPTTQEDAPPKKG